MTDETETPERAKNEARIAEMEAFAHQLFDRGSPTFGNIYQSIIAAVPRYKDEKQKTAQRQGERWCRTKTVRLYRERLLMRAEDGGPISKAAYVELLLRREAMYATRGGRGDAQAAVMLVGLLGDALDYFPNKRKSKSKSGDMAGVPDAPKLPSGEQMDSFVQGVLESAERLKRLREQNPVAKLKSGGIEVLPGEPVISMTVDDRNKAEALERRRMCVNHPEKIAHHLTWKSDRPLCKDCLAPGGAKL